MPKRRRTTTKRSTTARSSSDGLRFSKTEYLGDIIAHNLNANSTLDQFHIRTFKLNPGLEKMAPFGSQLAANFDEYSMSSCTFHFRSSVGEYATNGQLGKVLMCTQYNVQNPVFDDKVRMLDYSGANSGMITQDIIHHVDCSKAKGKFIRVNENSTVKDVRDYDFGNFSYALSGLSAEYANKSLGELWITYTVHLKRPKLFTGRGLAISQDLWAWGEYVKPIAEGTYMLGFESDSEPTANRLKGAANSIGTTITNTGTASDPSTTIHFPPGFAGFADITVNVRSQYITEAFNNGTFLTGTRVTYTGQVDEVMDMYGCSLPEDNVDEKPRGMITCKGARSQGGQVYTTFMLKLHVRIKAQIDDNENSVTLIHGQTYAGAETNYHVDQGQILISEYNSGMSYRQQNLGPSDYPVLVDSTGQITKLGFS